MEANADAPRGRKVLILVVVDDGLVRNLIKPSLAGYKRSKSLLLWTMVSYIEMKFRGTACRPMS